MFPDAAAIHLYATPIVSDLALFFAGLELLDPSATSSSKIPLRRMTKDRLIKLTRELHLVHETLGDEPRYRDLLRDGDPWEKLASSSEVPPTFGDRLLACGAHTFDSQWRAFGLVRLINDEQPDPRRLLSQLTKVTIGRWGSREWTRQGTYTKKSEMSQLVARVRLLVTRLLVACPSKHVCDHLSFGPLGLADALIERPDDIRDMSLITHRDLDTRDNEFGLPFALGVHNVIAVSTQSALPPFSPTNIDSFVNAVTLFKKTLSGLYAAYLSAGEENRARLVRMIRSTSYRVSGLIQRDKSMPQASSPDEVIRLLKLLEDACKKICNPTNSDVVRSNLGLLPSGMEGFGDRIELSWHTDTPCPACGL
jgi:hypothetical protein